MFSDTRDDRCQPAAEVFDLARIRAAQLQPRVLDGVVGLGQRAEHPVGHRAQAGPVFLEARRQPLVLVHLSRPSSREVIAVDP
jgi:hypothetical protein